MAVGTVSEGAFDRSIKLLEGAAATNGAPSLISHGVSVNDLILARRPQQWFFKLFNTAGTGTLTATVKLWGWDRTAGKWAPIGTGATDVDRGKLNGGAAIGEVGNDIIAHTERLEHPLAALLRLYAEITAIGGTTPAFDAYAVIDF